MYCFSLECFPDLEPFSNFMPDHESLLHSPHFSSTTMATSDSPTISINDAQPVDPPKNLLVGCINPRALVEAVLGRTIDWADTKSSQLIVDTLKKPYEELFDPKFGSPLYAGLKLSGTSLVRASLNDIKVVTERDLLTPDLSILKRLQDLKGVGVDDLSNVPVKSAWLTTGRLNLQLTIPALDKSLTNLIITKPIFDLVLRGNDPNSAPTEWTPPNTSWKDVGDFMRDVSDYDDPIQGAVGDCWLIAALASVAWATPQFIIHKPVRTGENDAHANQLTFYSKGGSHDAATGTVQVTDSLVVNASNSVVYCRSRTTAQMWPSLYEKAFAKWSVGNTSDKPDITALAGGDPAKATAQLTNRKALYYATASSTADALWGVVRAHSLSYKTIDPMTAWTYGSGSMYDNSSIVANHAYSVLGWAAVGDKHYIILRNPWGYLEPNGAGNTLQGLLSFFDSSFWRWINMASNDGVFALEAGAFKMYFAYLGVAVV